jgi:DNA-binding response OmpR family regulator
MAPAASGAIVPDRARPGGPKTVLVVENDPNLLEIVTLNLMDCGFEILAARSGPEALERLRTRPDVALVFADYKLDSAMSGADLAREAQAIKPALKVLLTSGHSRAHVHRHPDAARLPWLRKPYRVDELVASLTALLDRDTAARRAPSAQGDETLI